LVDSQGACGRIAQLCPIVSKATKVQVREIRSAIGILLPTDSNW
jgi:hypothetical protein